MSGPVRVPGELMEGVFCVHMPWAALGRGSHGEGGISPSPIPTGALALGNLPKAQVKPRIIYTSRRLCCRRKKHGCLVAVLRGSSVLCSCSRLLCVAEWPIKASET